MPRKHAMPPSEVAICNRLKEFREFTGLSLPEFAALAGIKPAAYLGYEYKRAQLNYPAAWKILCRWPWLDPRWLAGESKTMLDLNFTVYPRPDQLEHGPRASFSDVYDLVLKPMLLKAKSQVMIGPDQRFRHFDLTPDAAGRFKGKEFIGFAILNCLAFLPDEKVNQSLEELLSFIGELNVKYPTNTNTESGVLMFKEMLRLQSKNTLGSLRWAKISGTLLTDSESHDLIGGVKARLPELLARLKEATAAPGKKTELADFLSKATGEKVPLASVSRWLAGEREPGGEVALQMDAWATKQGLPK